ncbi:MAG: DEAD/DEAH box helicase [Fulvivirga sp.]
MNLGQAVDKIIQTVPAIIRLRGKEIFQRNSVELAERDEWDNFYAFEVEGDNDSFYGVDVFFEEVFSTVEIGCTCRYSETNSYCKHMLAGLFYLRINFGGAQGIFPNITPPKKKITKSKLVPQPLKIDSPPSQTPDPEILLAPYNEDFYGDVYEPVSIKILPDRLEAVLRLDWQETYYQPEKVTLEWNPQGHYLIYCDEHEAKCDHIGWMINFIISYKDGNILQMVRGEHQRAKAHEWLETEGVGINGEKLEDVFDMEYIEDTFVFVPKGRIKGLFSSKVVGSFLQDTFLRELEENKQKLVIGGEAEMPSSELLPAFVFVLNDNKAAISDVLSMCGKPNKDNTKINSYLQLLDSPYEAGLMANGNLIQSFLLKEEVNALLNRRSEEMPARLFSALYDFIEEIGTECKYVCIRNYHDYYDQTYIPKKSDLQYIANVQTGGTLKFTFSKETGLYTLRAFIVSPEGKAIDLEKDEVKVYNKLLVLHGSSLILMNSLKEGLALGAFTDGLVYRSSEKNLKSFLEEVVDPLAKEFPIEFGTDSMNIEHELLEPVQKRLYISELNQFVIFRAIMLYQADREVNIMEQGTVLERGDKNIVYDRDIEAEDTFMDMLTSLHPSFRRNTQQGFFYLSHKEMQKEYWFLKAFETLKKHEVHVFGFNELKNFKFSPHKASVSLGFNSGQDWFEANISVAFGNNKVTTKDLRKAIKEGNNYIELSDGTLGVLPDEWMGKFSKLFRTSVNEKETTKVSKTHFSLLDDLIDEQLSPDVFKEIEEKKQRLASFTGLTKAKTPANLKAILRPYQQEGLNWLNFLREYGWGGILADDMGLGKTLQALALICMELKHKKKQTNLVIAPTTLLFNWKNEIEKFAPGLDYFIHHGQRYDDARELNKHQLVLTSYGVVVNDIDLLKKINFNLIIADESQAVKNINSKRHKVLIKLKGRVRLAMSGTPIENNIYELYAQMNFANPGFFQSLSSFKQDYVQAVERNKDADIVAELRKKIKPFILRRTKEQVLTELPDKTEEYIYCEMSAGQRKVYDAYRNEYRNYLLKKFEEEGIEKSQMYVLEGLTRLRQVCDSPQLIDDEKLEEHASAKMEELITHVQEKTGHHKILVFSQFVKMLKLIEERFKALDIPYEYLDGKTSLKKREQSVAHFQEDPECRVFLISLKAGGTGLNLTAADYVYIVDPWWNPAVENQAIDRCYRMGQQKKVFAYRMICKDTVEEKIVSLQDKKRSLSEDIVGGEGGVLKSLSREDIVALFS